MLKRFCVVLCLVLVLTSGCRQNTADPLADHERIKSVSYTIPLPDQGAERELVELQIPFDLGVRVGVVMSVAFSCRGVVAAAKHACGQCESTDAGAAGKLVEYDVPKFLDLVVTSNSREFRHYDYEISEGDFAWQDTPLDCSGVCDAVFNDGLGVLKISYGTRRFDDVWLCHTPGAPLEYCTLDPGEFRFLDDLEITITYHDYYLPPADE